MNRNSRLDRLASFLLEPSRLDPPGPEAFSIASSRLHATGPEPQTPSTGLSLAPSRLPSSGPEPLLKPTASFLLAPSKPHSSRPEAEKPYNDMIGSEAKPSAVAGCLVQGRHASHNAWRWQLEQSDPSLLSRPHLSRIMERLNATSVSGFFDLRLPKVRLASGVLQHCIAIVAAVARCSLRFKVGITTDPSHRFLNESYGYKPQTVYNQMIIIAILKSMEAAGFLEAALIREFRDHPGCGNEAGGGEGSSTDASLLGFVYVVRCENFVPEKRQRVV